MSAKPKSKALWFFASGVLATIGWMQFFVGYLSEEIGFAAWGALYFFGAFLLWRAAKATEGGGS